MKTFKETERKYWKYQKSTGTFTQPAIGSSNSKDGMKLSGDSEAYKLFDNDDNTYLTFWNAREIIIDFDYECSLTEMEIYSTYQYVVHIAYGATSTIYAWQNNSWVTLGSIPGYTESNWRRSTTLATNKSNRYRIYLPASTASAAGSSYTGWINSITLRGTKEVTVSIPATKDDYDYYTDVPTYRLPKLENKYYGINQ